MPSFQRIKNPIAQGSAVFVESATRRTLIVIISICNNISNTTILNKTYTTRKATLLSSEVGSVWLDMCEAEELCQEL